MDANLNGLPDGAAVNGLPDEATLTRLASEFFAALPGEAASLDGWPGAAAPTAPQATVGVPPGTTAGPRSESTAASPALTQLNNIPDTLEESGITLHAPPRREAVPRWDPLAPPAAVPAGPGRTLADPYAPLRAQEFYFAGPLQLSRAAAPLTRRPGRPSFDVEAIRRDFPILAEHVHGQRLVWLDNAATTQKPQEVIDRLVRFYAHENSNIHRAAHELAARATQAYEDARDTVARFLGAPSSEDIVFVRGTTEAINLVAQSWGRTYVGSGDEIVLSCLEHHANIVPWQLLAEERGARLRVIPVDDSGQIILDEYRKLLTDRTRVVAVAHVSNALGTILPLREIIGAAHDAGAAVLVDGAQAVSHMPVDVRELDADFYVLSGHKVFGPTGIGALYAKPDVLDSMPPWQGGGNMIRDVTFEHTVYQPPPTRFEAGTPRSRTRSASAPPWSTSSGSAGRTSPAMSKSCSDTRRRRWRLSQACAWSARQPTRRPSSRSSWTGTAPKTWDRPWTPRGSRCAPGTTARSLSCGVSG